MTEVYEANGRRVGVRWSRAGLDAELRALAARALGVQAAPPNISVVVGERAGRTRSKHQLHVQGKLSSTIGNDGGLIRAVIRAVGTVASESPSGSLPLHAFLMIDPNGSAVAVDRRLTGDIRALDPVIRRRRWRVLQLPHLDVWPHRATAELVDSAAAAGVSLPTLDARFPLEAGDDDLAAGQVPIGRLVYAGRPPPASRADAVADMVPTVRDPTGRVRRGDVAHLAALTERVPSDGVLVRDRQRLAAVLGLS